MSMNADVTCDLMRDARIDEVRRAIRAVCRECARGDPIVNGTKWHRTEDWYAKCDASALHERLAALEGGR